MQGHTEPGHVDKSRSNLRRMLSRQEERIDRGGDKEAPTARGRPGEINRRRILGAPREDASRPG